MNDYDDRSSPWGRFWWYAVMAGIAVLPLVLAIFASVP